MTRHATQAAPPTSGAYVRRTAVTFVALMGTLLMITGCAPGPVPGGPGPSGPDIELIESRVIAKGGNTFSVDLYRNNDLECGWQGNFTFVVIEPRNSPGAVAPLWVYLHGGGVGYYTDDEPPVYFGDEENNNEESLDDLVLSVYSGGDTIMMRRLAQGWRVLAPSMCDHDLHSGSGNVYPRNPHHGAAGDTVDGLDANQAALRFTAQNRPTTQVVIHGTSAGSVGAFSLAYSLHEQGIDVNAAILDAYLITPRLVTLFEAGVTPQQNKNPTFDFSEIETKVGRFATIDAPDGVFPERVIGGEEDFRAVPLADVVGTLDPHCAGQLPALPAVDEANNCVFVHAGLADAIGAQTDSPHTSILVPDGDHSTTKDPGSPVHDMVDGWLMSVLAADHHEPFG